MTIIKEFPLSKEGFLYMKMLAQRCGVDLTDYKKSAMLNRLAKRLRILKIPDFDIYCNRLRMDLEEELIFINLITNSTTHFFRENHHFEYLGQMLLKGMLHDKNKLRIWSAGCSTGEEVYSIAMTLLETIPNIQDYDIKILATDINTDALTEAEYGIYPEEDVKRLSFARQKLWFSELPEHHRLFEVKDALKSLITFNVLNLVDTWPMRGPFDIIFCRNVLIYFKKEICENVLMRFHQILAPKGVLFLGHSESINELRNEYQSLGKTIYKKIR